MQAEEHTTRADEPHRGEWQEYADEKWLAKPVRNHIFRMPVLEIQETDSSRDSSLDSTAPETPQRSKAKQYWREILSLRDRLRSEKEVGTLCHNPPRGHDPVEDPGLAHGVRKMLEMFKDLNDLAYMARADARANVVIPSWRQ